MPSPLINIEGCILMYDIKQDEDGNIHLRLNNKAKEFFKLQEDDLLYKFSTFEVSPGLKLPTNIVEASTQEAATEPEPAIKTETNAVEYGDNEPKRSKKRSRLIDSSKKIIYNGSTTKYTDVREFLDLNLTGIEIKMCSIADAKFETPIKMNKIIEIVNNEILEDDRTLIRNVRNKDSFRYIIKHCIDKKILLYIELLLSSGSYVHFKIN